MNHMGKVSLIKHHGVCGERGGGGRDRLLDRQSLSCKVMLIVAFNWTLSVLVTIIVRHLHLQGENF